MEGVGARLGRSSTRYGPTTVFTGPVRKWKKKWVHVSPSSTSANHTSSQSNGANSNASHLLLYKWSPISQSNNGNGNGNGADKTKDEAAATPAASEEIPRKKFKYIPIAVLEEEKKEEEIEEEVDDDEVKPSEVEMSEDTPSKTDEKPDMNDVPMEEEAQAPVQQDLNETSLDLSLGLNGDHDLNPKPENASKEGAE